MATSPRVTRFKIDWGDGEDGENVPPPNSTESESNQMVTDSGSSQVLKEETMDAPLKMESSISSAQSLVNGTGNLGGATHCSTDSNGMDLMGKNDLPNSSAMSAEAMQL